MTDQVRESFARSLSSVQALLLSFADIDEFLEDLADLAADAMPGAAAGITTRYNETDLTVASSEKRSEQLDESQYRAGGGPCLDAFFTGQIVMSPDTATETRWPAYTAVAQGYGLRSSLSLPMTVGGTTLAALNIYSFDKADAFGPDVIRQYQAFAAQAAISLRLATRHEKDGVLLMQLEAALNSRTVIDQALGILMMQRRCTSTEAFDLLRRQSQNSHRKLRDVATDLVTRTSGEPPAPGKPFAVD